MGFLSARSPKAEAEQAASPMSDAEAQVPSDASLRIAKLEERCTDYEERCAKYEAGIDELKNIIDRLDKKVEEKFAAQSKKEAGKIKDLELKEHDTARRVELLEAAEGTEAIPLLSTKSSFLDDTFKEYEVALPESIYADLVLTLARGYIWPSITSTLLFLVCITMQWVFIIIVSDMAVPDGLYDSLNSQSYWGYQFINESAPWPNGWYAYDDDKRVGNYTHWEYCKGGSWTWESSELEGIGDYVKVHWIGKWLGSNTCCGVVLGLLSLFLWAGACTAEVRAILNFVSLLSLPSVGTEPSYQFEKGNGQLVSLGLLPRIAVVVVALCRIAMVCCLGEVGCRFLAYTTDLTDFILNAVALSFVLDIDELGFTFLSPNKIRALTTLDAPLMKGYTAKAFHAMAPIAEVASVLLIVLIVYHAYTMLDYFADAMVWSAVYACGGELVGNLTEFLETGHRQ